MVTNVITSPERMQEGGKRVEGDMVTHTEVGTMLLPEGGHEPRNVSGLWKLLKRVRRGSPPKASRRNTILLIPDASILALGPTFSF